MARRRLLSSMVALIAAVGSQAVTLASAAGEADANDVRIDVPVVLKDAKVVFNLDHPAFEGDEPTGLNFMRLMLARFRADHTSARIVAVFHGALGVSSRRLLAHSYRVIRRLRYGTDSTWERHNDGGGPSSDTP